MCQVEVDLSGEVDWSSFSLQLSQTHGPSFIADCDTGERIRMKSYVRESDAHLFAKVWFGPEAQGPPGCAHGGSKAAVLDHAMGIGCWVAGHPVVAATITIDFRAKLPLNTVVTVESWVTRVEGKKVFTEGRIYLDDPEKPYTKGTGLFIKQSLESFKGFLEDDQPSEVTA